MSYHATPATVLRAVSTLTLSLLWVAPLSAQTWQRVVQQGDAAGAAIGGGVGDVLYAGLATGPVFRSVDNGRTWTAANDGLVDGAGRMLPPKAFVTTPTGRVIRAGDNASWDNRVGSPIFYSDVPGGRWTEVRLPFGATPRNPAGIGVSDVVMHRGALYFADLLSEGVWKSTDDGLTWNVAGASLPTVPFVNVAKTYYAIASAGDALLTVQASKGVFRSTDGGVTWTQAVNGIPGVPDSPLVGGRTWNGSDVTATSDGTAFAVSDNRVYRSRDGGVSWTEVGAGILQGPNPFAPSVVVPSARKVELLGDRVYVSTTDANPRFFEGTALGDSWTELPRIDGNTDNGSLLSQSFHAHNGALYFAGSRGIHRLDLATAARTNLAPVVTVSSVGTLYANVGGRVAVAAAARGTAPFTYTWSLNGAAIPGQGAALLDFSPQDTNQAGAISVVVSNAAGSVTNVVGSLVVAPSAPGNPDYSFRPQAPGTVTTFAIDRDGSAFVGGPFTSQLETYTGVRRVFPGGTVDGAFVTGAVIGSGSGPGVVVGPPRTLLPLGDGSVLVGAADTGDTQRYYRRLLADGSIDPAWPWPQEVAGGPRKIVRLPDGRFLVAGGSAGGIHRLNADGTFDPTFAGPASIGRFQANYVADLAVLPSGHIVVVGKFNDVDGVARVGVARLLPSGVLDRAWVPAQPPLNSTVNAVEVQADGRILLGGVFTSFANVPRRGLARLNADGTLDATLGALLPATSPASTVYAFASQPDGKVWVGGFFPGVQGRNHLLRLNLDGTIDATAPDIGLASAATSLVNTLRFTADGRLWVGGGALVARGQALGNLARFLTDVPGPALAYGGLDRTPDPGSPVTLRGTVSGPYLSLQWRFQGVPIPGATSLDLSLGNVSLAASGAYDLVATSAGGSHTSAPVSVRVRGPVVIDLPPTPAVGILSNSVSMSVGAFGRLPLGYQWLKDGRPVDRATNRTLLLTNLALAASGDYAVRVTGGDGSVAESPTAFLAVIPPPGATNAQFRPALFTTTTFTQVKDLALLPNGQALVGGNFSITAPGGPNAFLARLNGDGSVDPAFRPDPTGILDLLALETQPDGRITVLVRLASGSAPFVVRRLLPDGSRDPGFAEATVLFGNDLKVQPDGGVLVIRNGGMDRFRPDGTVDAEFNQRARLNGQATAVDVDPAGRIYVGGFFTTVGGVARPQFARLLADGSLDASFVPTATVSGVQGITAQVDGALVGDQNGFLRFSDTGAQDLRYGWSTRLAVWDVGSGGVLAGVLNDTQGNGILRAPDGAPALPAASFKVPTSFSGYSLLRVGPDGSLWLSKGSNGTLEPSSLLYRLHGALVPLALVAGPQSQEILAGADATFTAAASGTSKVSYQWRRDGVDLVGETNATLVVRGAKPGDAGVYGVVVSNRSGSVTSPPATLALVLPPRITEAPASVVVSAGDVARFAVAASGVQLRYQWRLGAAALPGATNASLSVSNVGPSQVGVYSVLVSNPAGTNQSPGAKLRLRPVVERGVGTGPTDGLVRRWRFEGDLVESVGGLKPIPTGNPGFTNGIEGASALRLRSGLDWVQLGDGPGVNGRLTDETFTVTFWIRPETAGSINPFSYILLSRGLNLGTFVGREMILWLGGTDNFLGKTNRLQVRTTTFNSVTSTDARAYVPNLLGKWTHFAVVYRGVAPNNPANFSVFIDGQKIVLGGGPIEFDPTNLQNAIGRYAPSATFQMDDFRVYNRPLADAEVAQMVVPPNPVAPPVIVSQPVGGSARVGDPFALSVQATGPDLFYEWYRGSTLLGDADTATLSLGSLTLADAGEYRVLVSNGGGSTNSLPASLVVQAVVQDPIATWAAAAGLVGADALPGADPDGDGANNLSEFYYATSPTSAAARPGFSVTRVPVAGVDFPAITFLRRQAVGTAQLSVQVSSSLQFLDELGFTAVSVTPIPGGLEQVVLRSNTPDAGQPNQFFRLTVRP